MELGILRSQREHVYQSLFRRRVVHPGRSPLKGKQVWGVRKVSLGHTLPSRSPPESAIRPEAEEGGSEADIGVRRSACLLESSHTPRRPQTPDSDPGADLRLRGPAQIHIWSPSAMIRRWPAHRNAPGFPSRPLNPPNHLTAYATRPEYLLTMKFWISLSRSRRGCN